MQDIVGILLLFMGAASGSLFQDPVLCNFTERINNCSVALGQRLHLQIPHVDKFQLKFIDKTFTNHSIFKYGKPNSIIPNISRWQYDNKSYTIILTSAERNDSGIYTLDTFYVNGISKGNYTLQLYIKGDTAHTLRILGLVCLLLILIAILGYFMYRKKQGLKNKEVQAQDDAVQQAMVVTPPPSQEKKEGDVQSVQAQDDAVEQVMVVTPPSQEKKESEVQDAQAQDDAVEHAIVVTPPIQKKEKKKKKKKKNECEVQYGELVFNTPGTKGKEMPKVQEESVYSQIQHG